MNKMNIQIKTVLKAFVVTTLFAVLVVGVVFLSFLIGQTAGVIPVLIGSCVFAFLGVFLFVLALFNTEREWDDE
jgi:O-antigen/teichoic acid export membrane protein